MTDASEAALFALAHPVVWTWHHAPGQWGQWLGECHRAIYHIVVPPTPDDVDARPQYQLCRQMTVTLREDNSQHFCPFTTLDEARAICVRHAVTGDMEEMRAARKAFKAENKAYDAQVQKAYAQLNELWRTHNPPLLVRQPNDRFPMKFQLSGTQGVYHVHFERERRWVVRFVPQQEVRAEHCFFTREIVMTACSFHAHMGKWRGMMETF